MKAISQGTYQGWEGTVALGTVALGTVEQDRKQTDQSRILKLKVNIQLVGTLVLDTPGAGQGGASDSNRRCNVYLES